MATRNHTSFEKGHRRVGGRQKGTPNKATAEVKLVAQVQTEAGDHVAPECLPRSLGPERHHRVEALLEGHDPPGSADGRLSFLTRIARSGFHCRADLDMAHRAVGGDGL